MGRSRSEFIIDTLIFCIIVFTLVTVAHTFALIVKGDIDSMNTQDINYQYGNTARQDNGSKSNFDVSSLASGVGGILIGIDMPMPMPIIVTVFNVVMVTIIVYCVSELIKSWIPLMPSG